MHEVLLALDDWLFFKFDFGWSFVLIAAELAILFRFYLETFWEKVIIIFGFINYLYLTVLCALTGVASPYRDYRHLIIVELADGEKGITFSDLISEFFNVQYVFLTNIAGFGLWAPILAIFYLFRKYLLFQTHVPKARRYGLTILVCSSILFLFSWAFIGMDSPNTEWCEIHSDTPEEKQLCLQKLR